MVQWGKIKIRQWCNEGRLRLGNGAMREVRWGKGAMREERRGEGVIKKESGGKGVMKKERWGCKSGMIREERWGKGYINWEKDEAKVQWSVRNMRQWRWERKDKWSKWIFAKPELDPEYCADEKREHQSRSSTFQPRKLKRKKMTVF